MITATVRLATALFLMAGLVTGDARMLFVSIVLFCLARGMDLWMARRG